METGEARRAAKIPEWQQRVCECRNSGQPVKRWCEEHHRPITVGNVCVSHKLRARKRTAANSA